MSLLIYVDEYKDANSRNSAISLAFTFKKFGYLAANQAAFEGLETIAQITASLSDSSHREYFDTKNLCSYFYSLFNYCRNECISTVAFLLPKSNTE